jgi:LysR family transcriptional regulator, cyn operon transcriptional activator
MFPDLRFAPTFAAIYEARNLTRAALAVRRTQPAVSYQLRRIEEALAAPLFVRGRGGMQPTPLADELYALLHRFGEDLARLRSGDDDADRPLAIASVSGFGRHVLAPLLRRPPFDRQRVVLRFPVADEVIERTVRGEVDVGFVFRAVAHARLATEPVHEATYVLVASAAWARRLATPSRFVDVPVITYDEGDFVLGRWLGHHFGRRPPRWQPADHFEELDEVIEAVAARRGVAVVPGICARRRGIREVHWGRPPLLNTVHAVRRPGAPRPSVATLLTRLRAVAAR